MYELAQVARPVMVYQPLQCLCIDDRYSSPTAVVASMGTPTAFKDAPEFAAWIGLVPRQTGTGRRVRQMGIGKRGDVDLRTLLMHGARAVVIRSKDGPTWPWLTALLQRRPYSVADDNRDRAQAGRVPLSRLCRLQAESRESPGSRPGVARVKAGKVALEQGEQRLN